MAPRTSQRSVLVIGRSQLVLDDTVAALRDLGYMAQATSNFTDVTSRFNPRTLDLVVFGGRVPPDRKAELRDEISAINPRIIFVQGLAGIPGLIVSQVQGAFAADGQDPTVVPSYAPDERSVRLALTAPSDVTVTIWWQTSFVPPDPKSDSLQLLNERLPSGDHLIPLPGHIPPTAMFATVQTGTAVYAFSITDASTPAGEQ